MAGPASSPGGTARLQTPFPSLCSSFTKVLKDSFHFPVGVSGQRGTYSCVLEWLNKVSETQGRQEGPAVAASPQPEAGARRCATLPVSLGHWHRSPAGSTGGKPRYIVRLVCSGKHTLPRSEPNSSQAIISAELNDKIYMDKFTSFPSESIFSVSNLTFC